MKKRNCIVAFSLFVIVLASCQNKEIISLNPISSPTSTVENKKYLSLSSSPTENYQQFDELDLKDLSVEQVEYKDGKILSQEPIKDYDVSVGGKVVDIRDSFYLKEIGNFEVIISKSGYESTSFTINVSEARNVKQFLSLTSLPNKTIYKLGDKFDESGLEALLYTSYNGKGDGYSQVDAVSSYQLTYKGVDAKELTFSSLGVYSIEIKVKGFGDKQVTSQFDVLVEDSTGKIVPSSYVDPTIAWEKDQKKMTVSITNPEKSNTDKGYYSPSEVQDVFGLKDLAKNNAFNWHYTPSKGDVPLLVVPVVVPGYEDQVTSEAKNKITKAFFGNSNELNFESLHSYYMKSSFNQLNFTGTVTDFFIS